MIVQNTIHLSFSYNNFFVVNNMHHYYEDMQLRIVHVLLFLPMVMNMSYFDYYHYHNFVNNISYLLVALIYMFGLHMINPSHHCGSI